MNVLRYDAHLLRGSVLFGLYSIAALGQSLPQPASIYIAPGALPGALGASHQVMGARMTGADKAISSLSGTVTDANGTRAAQIVVQAPGYLSYREGSGRAVTFDGSQSQTKTGAITASDQSILESLLAYLPDSVYLQAAAGGSFRRIGSHFRTDDGTSKNYSGPYWTLIAFSPQARKGAAVGGALQMPYFIAIDERTGLIAEVRTVVNSTGPTKVVQTQFSNWIQQSDQWFPGKIVRIENGVQTLSFQTQQASTGSALDTAVFKP